LILRLVTHLYQGPQAVFSILPIGVVLSAYYWKFGKLWPPILAHVLLDAIPLMRFVNG
jgi:membrane protease YdiL (CAAX protease family)